VSESDILGPIEYVSDIENIVSFERAMFADYIFNNKIKIFLFFFVYITTLKYIPKAWWTVYMSNIRVLHFINTFVVYLIRYFCKEMIYLHHI